MSKERTGPPLNRQILDEAAEWFVEINEGEPDRATRERFDEWLRRSPEHVRAYLRVVPVWEEGASLQSHANRDTQALVAWAKEGDNVVPLRLAHAEHSRGRFAPLHSFKRLLLAASLGCIAVGAVVLWMTEAHGVYDTGTGEQHLVALADGSRIELNSRSRLRVRFTDHERSVELIQGQALFRVAKDTRRPFVVHSGETFVRAVGTEFDVYKKRIGTVVTVVEGSVSVTAPASTAPAIGEPQRAPPAALLLSAGEQAVVSGSAASHATQANVNIATAWTQQRLIFSRTPLTEVAEEFNRYNKRQLIVKSGDLKDFKVSGSFSSVEPASLVRFLRMQPGIHVDETDVAILISAE